MTYLPQEEICPISEQLLFSLYDAAKRGLPVPVGEVPPERRSSVALFCYRRSHLKARPWPWRRCAMKKISST